MENYNFAESVNKSLYDFMKRNDKSVSMGLGHNDPKRIFNTTKNLLESFGESRCIEPPTSENALTGICFGMALKGISVCLTHQRFDFALLSFDQIINTIAKWKFMFSREFKNIYFNKINSWKRMGTGANTFSKLSFFF